MGIRAFRYLKRLRETGPVYGIRQMLAITALALTGHLGNSSLRRPTLRVRRTITLAAAAVVAAGVAAVPTSPAQAAPFQPTRHYLDLPSGTDHARVFAINNNGTIVGSVDDRAVKWNASTGVMTYLPRVPGYSYAVAWDINDDGDIVGSAASSSTSQIHRPVRWKPSGTVEFLAPEGSAATAISNDDHIAGWSGAAFGPRSVVRFVNSRAERLSGAPTHGSIGDVADGGVVTGYFREYMCDCEAHAFVHTRGQDPVMLPTTNDVPSMATAITGNGRKVAGTVQNKAVIWELVSIPFLPEFWTQTTLGSFRTGWETSTTGMSRSGVVVVGSADSGATTRAWAHMLGGFTELPGGEAEAVDVNDSGVVIGYAGSSLDDHPVVWR